MKNFKVEVSKWLEKYNLIRKAENEALLKEELHKEWFTLLSIQAMDNIDVSWNKFYFEILENWNIKTWTIVSNDIFKAYLKIKDELKYDLKYIYSEKETTLEEKETIIKELQEHYRIYLDSNKKELDKKQQDTEKKTKVVVEETVDNFAMKKEIDDLYKIITKVLEKLRYFIEISNDEYLTLERKEKLREVYNNVIKLKTSTNIPKLKQIWEAALIKIWEIELHILETKKTKESKDLLTETNKLLKEVWSKSSFIQKDKDLNYILAHFLENLKEHFLFWKKKKAVFEVDTKSSSYLKTRLLIEKYERKLKDLDKEILRNFYIYLIPNEKNSEQKTNFYLRKKVIKQNLLILKWRLTWKTFSYTKIIKWYNYFVDKVLWFFKFFNPSIFIVLIIYSFIFLLLNFINYFSFIDLKLNFNWMFYFIYLCFIYLFIKNIKWLLGMSFWVVILIFLFIFWVINF